MLKNQSILNWKKALGFTAALGSLVSGIGSPAAYAASLSTYRQGLAESVGAQEKAAERSAELLKLLCDSSPNVTPIKNPNPAEQGNSRRATSSNLIKSMMEKGIREIIIQEKFGKPIVFTPSTTHTVEDAIENRRQSRIKMCRDVYSKGPDGQPVQNPQDSPFEKIIQELSSISTYDMGGADARLVSVPGEIRDLINASANARKTRTPEEAFGSLSALEIEEGSIYALRFTDKQGQNTNVTLAMMLTYLSDEDEAFIAMIDCVLDVVESRRASAEARVKRHAELSGPIDRLAAWYSGTLKERDKIDIVLEKYNLEYYGKLSDYLKPKYEKAQAIHAALKSLSQESRRDLLAVLLRAQASEIAVGSEMGALSRKTGEMINQAVGALNTAKAAQASGDMSYFRQIQKQMDRLKDTLAEKAIIAEDTRKLIQNELGGGQ